LDRPAFVTGSKQSLQIDDSGILCAPALATLSFEHGILLGMSMFKVNVVARNPKQEELETQPIAALVDTGSELTWLPAEILRSVGITPRRKRVFATATQQKIEREVGYAILRAEGYETNDEVVFAEPSDMTLLGVRTLEGFGVTVDNVGHRFVATTTIVAADV
jgi:clan AA aspartic protease